MLTFVRQISVRVATVILLAAVSAAIGAPTVSITAPSNNSAANVGIPLTVTATATATTGTTITRVEFFAGGTSVGVAANSSSPYSVTWTPQNTGPVSLTARATDSNNDTTTSSVVTVTVGTSSLPTVSITAPTPAATLASGVATTVTATATASAGLAVTSVQFFANGVPIGTDTSPPSPFSVTWTPTTTGSTILTATATDSAGGMSTSNPVVVTVTGANPSLAVALALTGSTSIAGGSTRVLTATTTPTTGIDRVELLYDETVVGTDNVSPYGFLFTAPVSLGSHQLTARVVDSTGASALSSNIAIVITGATGSPPTIGISTPTANAFLAPATATTISGAVADSDGAISSVQVYVDQSSIGNATISGGIWSITWTTPATSGIASITAIATDNSGNAVASPTVGVNIADTASPAITLSLSPVVAGQTASTTFPSGAVRNFVANATPASGRSVVRVEFFIDGTKLGEDTTPPFTFRYTAPALAPGEQSHASVFSARATDNAGAARDVQVPLLVVQPNGRPPTVSLRTPANGASVFPNAAVSLAATASATGGTISSVQFYVNSSPAGINSGNAVAAAPYTSTFTPTVPGTYVIDAITTDDRGNTAISNVATITAAFATPTVAITSPNPNATARATPGVPLSLSASAVVQSGTGAAILLVEFLLDGEQIGARTTPTTTGGSLYTFSWTPTTAQLGTHQLTARVIDTNSQTVTSAPVNVAVADVVGTPPTIAISTTPIPTQGLQTLSQVNFIANAFPNGAGTTLTSVEFFLDDVSIGVATREQTTNLYRLAYDLSRFDFSTSPSTTDPTTNLTRYTPIPLYAIARDSNNNQTVSATNNLTINSSTSAPPTIQLTAVSPTTIAQGGQFLMQPNFGDSDGTVTQIQLYVNGTLNSATSNPQSGQSITYAANSSGRFSLFAVVTDDTGNTAISSPAMVINVTAVNAPITTITRPSDDTTVTTVNVPVFLEGTAVNNDTPLVPTLAFIITGSGGGRNSISGTRIGTTTTFRAIWTPNAPDTYSINTQASVGTSQGAGSQSTSAVSRKVVVTNVVGIAPSVAINVPGSTTTASSVNFTATATDSDGSVIDVEFFVNRDSIGHAVRDQLANSWRITASFDGTQPGSVEVVALARDNAGNVAASTTSNITVDASSSDAPSISISSSDTNPAFNRQVQLTANARDNNGVVRTVEYFANSTSLGQSTNASTSFAVNWTPNASGTFSVYAIATDDTANTTVSEPVKVTVRRNNPILESSAFILQTYQDIANTSNVNALIFADLDAQLGAGTLSRTDLVASLLAEPGFLPPVNLLATYYVLMGQWPTPQNYTALLATARSNLGNAIGSILSSTEYVAKYGVTPTTTLLSNPASAIPATTFYQRLTSGAGIAYSVQGDVAFRSSDVLSAAQGRGYTVIGLNQAIAEFITNTNSKNTALFAKARAAALYYQLDRPQVTITVDQITARIAELTAMATDKNRIDAVLKDVLYAYRYVTITKHPQSVVLAPRSGVIFTVEATGAPPLAYQWMLNGARIAGATASVLSLTNVDSARTGTYTVVITSPVATATSDPAALTLSNTPARLANISTRGATGPGGSVLIGGFVVAGANATQTRQMMIRVIGPSLAGEPFNVQGVLADPRLEVYVGGATTSSLTNDNWATQAGGAAQVTAIQQATTRAGAFALATNAADAVVLATLPPGSYTVQAKAASTSSNATGVVLIEVYDVTPSATAPGKAANVSTRGTVGTGGNILIAGFVVNGGVSRRMLIRGVGPTLTRFGLAADTVLADPQLTLINQETGRTIATNDDWAAGDDAAAIAAASNAAGAFALTNGSKDAAMLVMLAPGTYTVQLSGVNNGQGVGIVEVYDVDP